MVEKEVFNINNNYEAGRMNSTILECTILNYSLFPENWIVLITITLSTVTSLQYILCRLYFLSITIKNILSIILIHYV